MEATLSNPLVSLFVALILAGAVVWKFLSTMKQRPATSDQSVTMNAIGIAWNDRVQMQDIAAAISDLVDGTKDSIRVTTVAAESIKELCRTMDRLARAVEEGTAEMRRNR